MNGGPTLPLIYIGNKKTPPRRGFSLIDKVKLS